MSDAKNALEKAHCNNIRRYRQLLETPLTDVERSYIQARISEEQTALQSGFGPRTAALSTRDV